MVDTADSKSAEGNLMPVRVRPPLPIQISGAIRLKQKPLIKQGLLFYCVQHNHFGSVLSLQRQTP